MSQYSPYNHLPFRPCVGIMMLNHEKKVFVAKRIDTRLEAWQMPQGGIDGEEKPEEAMMRELMEEIGTNNVEIIAESKDWHNYTIPDHLVAKLWGGKYQGQRQKWFLVRYRGKDGDINIATKDPEFSSWKWAEAEKLPELIVPFKRALYAELVEEFRQYFLD